MVELQTLIITRLTIEFMVKTRFGMDLSVVDVDGWKEQKLQVPAWKRKRHRMNLRRAGFQLEDGKPPASIAGKFLPYVRGEAKPII